MLAPSLPHRERDLVVLGLNELDVHVHMSDVFRELSTRALDGNQPGLNVQSDIVRNSQLLGSMDIAHLNGWSRMVSSLSEGESGGLGVRICPSEC